MAPGKHGAISLSYRHMWGCTTWYPCMLVTRWCALNFDPMYPLPLAWYTICLTPMVRFWAGTTTTPNPLAWITRHIARHVVSVVFRRAISALVYFGAQPGFAVTL